jgi:arginine repressor
MERLPGDDTLFVALHDKEEAIKLCKHIKEYF